MFLDLRASRPSPNGRARRGDERLAGVPRRGWRVILAHEGTLERFTGDGIDDLLQRSVPVPIPPSALYAWRPEIRDRVGELTVKWQKLGYELSIGVGIAQGYATLGAIGFEGRLDYGAIGTVTNLAARLCGEAKPGEILISRRLMSTLETLIETKAVGELTLKGFAKPVTAFNVVGLTLLRA